MCGLLGILTSANIDLDACLNKGEQIQKHRGPDIQSREIFSAAPWRLAFAHQRLAILDLSKAGAQPMHTGNSCLIYNGEVYNYKELKSQLKPQEYQSTTDTEVVLHALETLNINKALPLFNGMWAFAWFNQQTQKLYLCRDRAGIKPLYYYQKENTLYFASEIKTILTMAETQFTLNHQAVGEYVLQSLQDTSEDTFYKEIKAVPAGTYIEIDLSLTDLYLNKVSYWEPLKKTSENSVQLIEQIQTLFSDAVALRMRSDVPVGVTLSGGLDSSSIAAVMQQHLGNAENLHIFSIVSPGNAEDESVYIDIMAKALAAKVHKIELDWQPVDAMELLKTTIWHNDAPIGSFSNVAHFLMMKKAHELGVTVILSGQGADELLCGYKKYLGFYLQYLIREKKPLKALSTFLGFIMNGSILNQFNFKEAKRYLPKRFFKKEISLAGPALKETYKPQNLGLQKGQTLQERQVSDLKQFSVPFLTHYEDRMSMAWSREIRLPFLDYRLMELFINLPTNQKIKKGWTKYILRLAMQASLPAKIVWRKDKQGFINPQESWLKNELKESVLGYFEENALIFKLGLIDRSALLIKYALFCSGHKRVWYREIFNPLALEIWLQLNKPYLLIPEG